MRRNRPRGERKWASGGVRHPTGILTVTPAPEARLLWRLSGLLSCTPREAPSTSSRLTSCSQPDLKLPSPPSSLFPVTAAYVCCLPTWNTPIYSIRCDSPAHHDLPPEALSDPLPPCPLGGQVALAFQNYLPMVHELLGQRPRLSSHRSQCQQSSWHTELGKEPGV